MRDKGEEKKKKQLDVSVLKDGCIYLLEDGKKGGLTNNDFGLMGRVKYNEITGTTADWGSMVDEGCTVTNLLLVMLNVKIMNC